MDETTTLRDPEFIAEAIEINRQRELEFRSKDIGIGLTCHQDIDLNIVAARLSALIDEVNDG